MLTVIFRQLYDIYSLSKGYLHLYVFTSDLPVLKLLDIMTVNFGVTSSPSESNTCIVDINMIMLSENLKSKSFFFFFLSIFQWYHLSR